MSEPLALVQPAPIAAPKSRILTSGQVAKLCGVATRTVCKWHESGRLKGFRLPGSQDRRFYADDLVVFLREHGIRVPPELDAPTAIVLYGLSDYAAPEGVFVAPDPFALGVLLAVERVALAVLGDDDGLASTLAAARAVRGRHPKARILFALSPDVSPAAVAEAGFSDCTVVARPLSAERLRPMLTAG